MFLVLLMLEIATFPTVGGIQCMQGIVDGLTAGKCDGDGETTCNYPIFKEYTGFVAPENALFWDCGACLDGLGVSCEECDGSETPCNTVDVADDFSCFTYAFNEEAQGFERDEEKSTCKRLQGTEVKCNSPKENTAAEDWTSSGCGPCAESDEHCETCDGDSCNDVIYGAPYSCLNYLYNEELSAFSVQEDKSSCKRVAGAEEQCNSPTKGAEKEAWNSDGCGVCVEEASCETCTGDSCVSASYTTVFECFYYNYNEELAEFQKIEEKSSCQLEEQATEQCNSPTKVATSADYSSDGCGPCPEHSGHTMQHEAEEHENYCEDCDGALCNNRAGAVTPASLLLAAVLLQLCS